MVCLACVAPGPDIVCARCRHSIRPGPIRRLPGNVVVVAGAAHTGAARVLVHRLKYQGLLAAADVLAALMAPSLPPGAAQLVPLPRAGLRRWKHGIDPAVELVQALAKRTGLEPVRGLGAAPWWPRHAGRERRERVAPRFRLRRRPDPGWVLVDDVVTSGATLLAAVQASEGAIRLGITATGVGTLDATALYADRLAEEAVWR